MFFLYALFQLLQYCYYRCTSVKLREHIKNTLQEVSLHVNTDAILLQGLEQTAPREIQTPTTNSGLTVGC